MADDTLTSLVSGASQSPEQTAAIVAELRRKQAYGALAQLSGDPALRPFGTSLLSDTQESIRQAGSQQLKNRSEDLADQQFKNLMSHQTAQEGQASSALSQAMEIAKMTDRRDRELAQQAIDAGKYDHNSTAQQRLLDQEQQRKDQFTQKLASGLTQNKIPQVGMAINTLNSTLDSVKDPDNIPGMGYLKNLPGAAMFLSSEGKNTKSQVVGLTNDLLSMYSGLNVTVPEEERRNLEMMASGKFSSADFAREWPRIVSRYNTVKNGYIAGYSPAVREQFKQNIPEGGFSLDDIVPQDPISKAARAAPKGGPGGSSGGNSQPALAAPTAGASPVTGRIGGQPIVGQRVNKRTGKLEGKLADGSIVALE